MYKYASKFLNSPNKPELNRVPPKDEFEWAIFERIVTMTTSERFVEEMKRRWNDARELLRRSGQKVSWFEQPYRSVQAAAPLEEIAPVTRRDVQRMSKTRLDRIWVASAAEHSRYVQVSRRVQLESDEMCETLLAMRIPYDIRNTMLRMLQTDKVIEQIENAVRAEMSNDWY